MLRFFFFSCLLSSFIACNDNSSEGNTNFSIDDNSNSGLEVNISNGSNEIIRKEDMDEEKRKLVDIGDTSDDKASNVLNDWTLSTDDKAKDSVNNDASFDLGLSTPSAPDDKKVSKSSATLSKKVAQAKGGGIKSYGSHKMTKRELQQEEIKQDLENTTAALEGRKPRNLKKEREEREAKALQKKEKVVPEEKSKKEIPKIKTKEELYLDYLAKKKAGIAGNGKVGSSETVKKQNQATIKIIIYGDQIVQSGNRVRFQTMEDLNFMGYFVPKNTILWGDVSYGGNSRMQVSMRLNNVVIKGKTVYFAKTSVVDYDGLEGIYISGLAIKEKAKEELSQQAKNSASNLVSGTVNTLVNLADRVAQSAKKRDIKVSLLNHHKLRLIVYDDRDN